MTKRIVLLVLAACLVPDLALAATAEERCRFTKLRAAGREARARFLCEARATPSGADPSCQAAAAERRDEAFRRAELRGGCATTGDSKDAGTTVAAMVDLFQDTFRPAAPDAGAGRCRRLGLMASARAADRLASVYASAGLAPNEARLVTQLERTRAATVPAFARARKLGGCAFDQPASQSYASFEVYVGRIRDLVCPTCGVLCPCWTTAELDAEFPPGAFSALGGTVCNLISLDYVEAIGSADVCAERHAGGFNRRGFAVAYGRLCLIATGDLDSDDDGTCNGFARVEDVDPIELDVCAKAMFSSRIYRQECRVPN